MLELVDCVARMRKRGTAGEFGFRQMGEQKKKKIKTPTLARRSLANKVHDTLALPKRNG